jgi:hypothetical protein
MFKMEINIIINSKLSSTMLAKSIAPFLRYDNVNTTNNNLAKNLNNSLEKKLRRCHMRFEKFTVLSVFIFVFLNTLNSDTALHHR